MNTSIIVGLIAGLASALLFVSITTGNALAILLFYIAPLPLFIAGFGWGLFALLIAAGLATISIAIYAHAIFAGVFIVSCAAPCFWLTRLALLSRPVAESNPQGPQEWYPAGRLVLWAGAFGAGLAICAIILFGGTMEGYRATIDAAIRDGLLGQPGAVLPAGTDVDLLVDIMTRYLAPVSAAMWTVFTLLNMSMAVRIAAASGNSLRANLGLRDMQLPAFAAAIFAVALAASFTDGTPGLYGKAAAGGLFAAFAFAGIATLFVLTRNNAAQPLILGSVFFFAMFIPLVAVIIAMLGLVDTLFDFRNRRGGPPPPPGSTST